MCQSSVLSGDRTWTPPSVRVDTPAVPAAGGQPVDRDRGQQPRDTVGVRDLAPHITFKHYKLTTVLLLLRVATVFPLALAQHQLPPSSFLALQPPCSGRSRVAMALEGGATRAPPPDQLATFYKLLDKKVIAGVLFRHARNAELSALASVQGEALFGEDSLVVAYLRYSESEALAGLCMAASGTEQEALLRRSWAVLVSLIPLLLRRLEADTLLPGTIREEEVVYDAHVHAAVRKAMNEPVPPPAVLRGWASTMSYTSLLMTIYRSLDLLALPLWPATQRRMVRVVCAPRPRRHPSNIRHTSKPDCG